MKSAVLLLSLLFGPVGAHAAMSYQIPAASFPEEVNGCGDAPDVRTGQEICGLYAKVEGRYGKYRILDPSSSSRSMASDEPDACRLFFTQYVRARNVICAYKAEAQALAASLSRVGSAKLPPAGQPMTDDQVKNLLASGKNYKAMTDMHQKYSDMLAKEAKLMDDATKAYGNMPGFGIAFLGGPQDSTDSRDRLAKFMLNTEKNCKGGSISNIPSFWWAGVNKLMVDAYKGFAPRIKKAVADAKKIADDGVKAFGGVEASTIAAARSMGTAGLPSAPTMASPAVTNPAAPEERFVPGEAALAAGIDRGTGLPLEAAKAGPGAIKIVGVLATIGVEGLRSGVSSINARTVFVAAIGAFGLVPGVAATVIDTIMANDDARSAAYANWGGAQLNANEAMTPQQLSQGFCQWLADEKQRARAAAAREGAAAQDVIRQSQMPGSSFGDPGMPGSPGNTD
jgi:hypothetical protein